MVLHLSVLCLVSFPSHAYHKSGGHIMLNSRRPLGGSFGSKV